MPVIRVDKDTEALEMTVLSEFDATVERVWQLWADPRQLERWWGPPGYPATFVDHDLTPGGNVSYFMTSPEGEKYHGWWQVVAAEAPRRLELDDGFGESADDAAPDMPITRMVMELSERSGGGTTMTMRSVFPSLEAMEQMIAMGMDEGIQGALGQIDDILAGG